MSTVSLLITSFVGIVEPSLFLVLSHLTLCYSIVVTVVAVMVLLTNTMEGDPRMVSFHIWSYKSYSGKGAIGQQDHNCYNSNHNAVEA